MTSRLVFFALLLAAATTIVSCSGKSNKGALPAQSQTSSINGLSATATTQTIQAPKPLQQQLYLLAASFGNAVFMAQSHPQATPHGFPTTLYRASKGKLEVVREINEDGGVMGAWERSIFLGSSDIVSIIHEDDPSKSDDVMFHPEGEGPITALAESHASAVDEIIPVYPPDDMFNGTLWSVSADVTADPRVRPTDWDEYGAMRLEGDPGGPLDPQQFAGAIVDDKLETVGAFGGHPTVLDSLDSLPTSFRNALVNPINRALMGPGITAPSLRIVVVDQRYFILERALRYEDLPNLNTSIDVFVHDRMTNHWKAIPIEGNLSKLRLFTPWLATIVQMSSGGPSPGRENERNFDTDRLPNVRAAYASRPGVFMPGVLVLQNIEDGRKIRIETGQEDSEVLSVNGDTVLYRVNDTIYQTTIAGSALRDTTVAVKDDDVPEVHWVFWSK